MQRTIFIGDVHGCFNELLMLTDTLKITTGDRVILMGDVINRGPFPEKVIRYIFEQGFECLKGNHEDDYCRHFHHPHLSLPDSYYAGLKKRIPPPAHDWLMSLPLYLDEPDFIAVHAGVHPSKPLHETEHSFLLSVRTCDGEGKNLNHKGYPPWYTYYTGTKKVIYGHWATQGLTTRPNTIGLDSGCVYGKKLSAYILETEAIVQVSATNVYMPVN
jgi:bis(5'-nucleosyl)-tetraphosphatase (symmetrical)